MGCHSLARGDDKEAARKPLDAAGVALIGGPFLDFRDPWGNRIEIVGYDNIQFTKAANVLCGMGLTHLTKNEQAKKELAEKDMSVRQDLCPDARRSVDRCRESLVVMTG